MAPHKPNPAGQGGAGRDLQDSASLPSDNLNQQERQQRPLLTHRCAALALLNNYPALSLKEAGFLGHVAVTLVLSEKQAHWLDKILAKHKLPPLEKGHGHG
jgi:hypothetical protein